MGSDWSGSGLPEGARHATARHDETPIVSRRLVDGDLDIVQSNSIIRYEPHGNETPPLTNHPWYSLLVQVTCRTVQAAGAEQHGPPFLLRRYLGRKYKMGGKDEKEMVTVDMIMEG